MGRPRSNLKAQLDWAAQSGAFDPPQFAMLDARDAPVSDSGEPSGSRVSPTKRIKNSQFLAEQPRGIADNAALTPPSLDSQSDSDLDALDEVMVVRVSPKPGSLPKIPMLPGRSYDAAELPPSSPHQQLDPFSITSSSSPPATGPSPPQEVVPFRMTEAPAPDIATQGPEIGSLLSEKIAIQEQKIEALLRTLAEHKIHTDTTFLDARLREVDSRIERFIDEDLEPQATHVVSLRTPGFEVPLPGHDFDLIDSDSDDEFEVMMARSIDHDAGGGLQATANANMPTTAGGSALSGGSGGDNHGGGPEGFVDLIGTSSDFEDSPYFNSIDRAGPAALDVEPLLEPGETMETLSSDIVMETAPPVLTQHQHPVNANPWTKEMMHILRTKFGLPGFRPNQLEAVNETLAGNDLVVLMPTGGGKSLCYQLPALCTSGATKGTTVVISPLISLMQDQVYHLKNRNIRAEMINSRLSAGERNQALAQLSAGELQLVYISPEMLSASQAMRSALLMLHSTRKLARIVIDEAHCVSSWGHDFRPDYKELDRVKDEYPGTPIMALTATANERVLLDIIGCLRENPMVLKQSFNRRNLVYEVRPKSSQVVNEIAAICRQFSGKTGIVYCFSKRSCEDTAADLRGLGISAAHYHAGMEQEERAQTQQDWQDGRCTVVCATIAFGMGIDKPDVRFVIHQTVPRNVEGYYQETGRAGRDGRISTCVMFYSYADVQIVRRMIDGDTNLTYADKDHHLALLNRMVQYCENTTDCRRKQVLQYFNESFDAKQCALMCDNCQNMRGQVVLNKDLTAEAKQVLQLLQSIQHRQVTLQQCIDVMMGRSTPKVRDCGFNESPLFGELRSMGVTEISRLAHHLVTERALEEYSVRAHSRYPQTYVRLGPAAAEVLSGQRCIKLKTVSGPVPSAGPAAGPSRATRTTGGARTTTGKRQARGSSSFRAKRGRTDRSGNQSGAAGGASRYGARSYSGRVNSSRSYGAGGGR